MRVSKPSGGLKISIGMDAAPPSVAEYLSAAPAIQTIMAHHTSPEQAGRIFADVKPRLAVFTHVGFSGDARVPAPKTQELITGTRTVYAAPLEVGEDLMNINVVDATVRRVTEKK